MAKKTVLDDYYEYDFFISYSRKNSNFVDTLVSDLKNHNISVWLDRLEIEIGDQPRARIEDAIDKCKYFCLVITDASMKSYYVRKLEIEAAFAKMIGSKRETYILPILRQKQKDKMPLMLQTIHYLDFRSSMQYQKNIEKLAKKIHLPAENFTGEVIYKNISTSKYGYLSGVKEIPHLSLRGTCIKTFFHDGKIYSAELYSEGKADAVKSFIYDNKGRIYEIILFRNNEMVDTWQYHYDKKTGIVTKKLIIDPRKFAHLEEIYDQNGNKAGRNELNQSQ